MNRSRFFLVIPLTLTLGLAVGVADREVSAQIGGIRSTPPQTIQDPTRTAKPTSPRLTKPRNSRGVTATGCLQLERAVASRPDVQEGGGGESSGYVLTGAKLTGLGVTSGGQEATAELYRVSGLEDAKLREHINQHVELKGRLHLGRVSSPEQTDEKSSGSSASSTDGSSDPKGLPAITATSIKMLASSCDARSQQ